MKTAPIRPIDGSVYAYQVSPGEALVYATIAGPGFFSTDQNGAP